MKIALSWLSCYLHAPLDIETVSKALTDMGLEVEHVEGYAPAIEGVVVAHIRRFDPHPSADKLRVATVFDGEKEIQVVCGDLRCPEDAKVPLATIGSCLPGGFQIKKAKLRGVESMGMLCALDELGFSEQSEGVHVLPQDAVCGENAFKWLNDPVLCLSLTPNLGYCLSVEAVAKQLAAKLDLGFHSTQEFELSLNTAKGVAPKVSDESGKCSEYKCLLIENVQAGPSPAWLARRMQQAGYRSVNTLVDAANWVMLEIGRPIHLFDADTLKGDLTLSLNGSEQIFSRIDGVDQPMVSGALFIKDQESPVAVAGVMGSRLHEVNDSTTRVLMEVAVFDASCVRKSAKLIGCNSEASRRFERGIDPTTTSRVFKRFVQILTELGLQPALGDITGFSHPLPSKREISLSSHLVKRLLDIHMGSREMAQWLARLDIDCEIIDQENLVARVPLSRHDLNLAEDLVEELLKLIGADNLPRRRLKFHLADAKHDPRYVISQSIRQTLWGRGLKEIITLDMVSSRKCAELGFGDKLVALKNPLTVDGDVLRPSLLASFLEIVSHNEGQQAQDMSFFEIGSIYSLGEGKTQEQLALGLLMSGQSHPIHWSQEKTAVDFYTLKGAVEQLLEYLGVEATFQKSSLTSFHPGQQAKICLKSGLVIGHIGRVHPRHEKSIDSSSALFYGEIGIEDLLKAQNCRCQYQPLAQFPGSERDWTLTLDESVSYEAVLEAIPDLEQLERVELLSIWRCEQRLGKDRKNLTLRFYYRHREKTMTQVEVESQHLLLKETVSRKLDLKN